MGDPNGHSSSDASISSQARALHHVAAVIFDWDGVLVDSGRNYYCAYESQEIGNITRPREIYWREGQPIPQLIATLCAERGLPLSDAKVKELAQRRREDGALARLLPSA